MPPRPGLVSVLILRRDGVRQHYWVKPEGLQAFIRAQQRKGNTVLNMPELQPMLQTMQQPMLEARLQRGSEPLRTPAEEPTAPAAPSAEERGSTAAGQQGDIVEIGQGDDSIFVLRKYRRLYEQMRSYHPDASKVLLAMLTKRADPTRTLSAGYPIALWGPPGEGKTTLFRLLSQMPDSPFEVVVIPASSLMHAGEIFGVPVTKTTESGDIVLTYALREEFSPDRLRRLREEGKVLVVVLDELFLASDEVKGQMQTFLTEYRISGIKPEDQPPLLLVATGNPEAGTDMTTPFADRFVHLPYRGTGTSPEFSPHKSKPLSPEARQTESQIRQSLREMIAGRRPSAMSTESEEEFAYEKEIGAPRFPISALELRSAFIHPDRRRVPSDELLRRANMVNYKFVRLVIDRFYFTHQSVTNALEASRSRPPNPHADIVALGLDPNQRASLFMAPTLRRMFMMDDIITSALTMGLTPDDDELSDIIVRNLGYECGTGLLQELRHAIEELGKPMSEEETIIKGLIQAQLPDDIWDLPGLSEP
ncbi:hypothetical protein HRbin15_00392 [bacterium HR15]|nr:hypothetical protein HRbin15_00392 [bacterium HR15]